MSKTVDTNFSLVSTVRDMNKPRRYDMTKRAQAAAASRQRILGAALELCWERLAVEITLDDVALRAGLSVKTLLRHFGSRDGLFAALEEFAMQEIRQERSAPAGDVEAAVHAIFEHYEHRGDGVLKMLGQELFDDAFREGMDVGRRMHREEISGIFAPQLAEHPPAQREALVDLLVIATDVYTWKLLRRDRGLDRVIAETRVRQLIHDVLNEPAEGT